MILVLLYGQSRIFATMANDGLLPPVFARIHPRLGTPRPFRTPGVPWLPMLGVLSCLGLLAGLGAYTWIRLGIWIAIGLVIYFLYGRFQSRLRAK